MTDGEDEDEGTVTCAGGSPCIGGSTRTGGTEAAGFPWNVRSVGQYLFSSMFFIVLFSTCPAFFLLS